MKSDSSSTNVNQGWKLEDQNYLRCFDNAVVPVAFAKEHKQMMQILMKSISDGLLKVHPQFEDIFVALKSAQNKGDDPYSLDKTKSSNHDILDALRLSLCSLKN